MNEKERIKAPDRIFARPIETECSYGYILEKDASNGTIEYVRKDIVEKLKDLASKMYEAAQYLTTDASQLRKAMKEYYDFINYQYNQPEND